MNRIRSKGNKSTETELARLLRARGLKGWRRHDAALPGKPDFVWKDEKVAVFVDGCFWHGCPRHWKAPKTRRAWWISKVNDNMRRDQAVRRALNRTGWTCVRIWEHTLREAPHEAISRIRQALSGN